jgi:signal transduction histidine kinase
VHAEAVAGFLSAWAVTYLAVAGYCLMGEAARRRRAGGRAADRGELPYLLFALLTGALAVYTAATAWFYVADQRWPLSLLIANAGRIAAVTFLVHLVLDYVEWPWKRWALALLYCAAALLEVANLGGGFYEMEQATARPVRVFGVVLREMAVPATSLSIVFAMASLVAVAGATALLGRAYVRGRREGLWSFMGGTVLAVAVGHDAMRAMGWIGGVELTPYGYAALVLGVLATLLEQYASLRRRLENRASQLRERSRELASAFEELRAAQSELVRKEQLAAVGELSAVVAHEVRNPLAIITNAVSTLRRPGVGDTDRDTLLGILDEETARLNRIVGDLLSYARPVRIERREVSVRELIERALVLAKADRDVIVELAAETPTDPIVGDPGLLRQAMENLITNAMQAMPAGGQLTVTIQPALREDARGVEVRFEDTGEGMNTSVRRRALDPFFTTRPRGTGLGLAIVARIIQAHGGELRIDSAEGAGTAVVVFLPHDHDANFDEIRGSGVSGGDRRSSLPPMPAELMRALGGRGR